MPTTEKLFVLAVYGPVNNEVMSSRSINSGTIPGQAAGVVPCGGRKTSPRTSTIVQFIFYFGPLRSAIIF